MEDFSFYSDSPNHLIDKISKRYQLISKAGEGSFGMVTSAIDRATGKQVAIKRTKMSKKRQGIPVYSLRQITTLKRLKHPNIIRQSNSNNRIYEVYYNQEEKQICFVLDYHPCNLYQYIKTNSPLTLKLIKFFTYQIFKSLQYLHKQGFIHRDLKPQNYLVSSQRILKLCDFGQAKINFFKPERHTPDISTLWYRSPEILMGTTKYNENVDLWSAGCIVAQLILGKPLFYATSQVSLLFSIFKVLGTPRIEDYPQMEKMSDMSQTYPKFQGQGIYIQGIPPQGNDFLRKLLRINPNERISAEKALRHDFLAGMEERQNSE